MREGIPHWPAYTNEKKEFMAINKYWAVKHDYSLVNYTQQRDNAIVQLLIIMRFLWYSITRLRWTRRVRELSAQKPRKNVQAPIGNPRERDAIRRRIEVSDGKTRPQNICNKFFFTREISVAYARRIPITILLAMVIQPISK